jgi:hypothetical protein
MNNENTPDGDGIIPAHVFAFQKVMQLLPTLSADALEAVIAAGEAEQSKRASDGAQEQAPDATGQR